MSKTFKRALVLVLLTVPFSLLIPYVALNLYGVVTIGGVPVKPVPVIPQYQNAFRNTCAVYTKGGGGATGIYLDTGFILTARHVVDTNRDEDLDWNERKVGIQFYSGSSAIHTGTVLYTSKGTSDFAIISAPNKRSGGVKLMSDEDYKSVLAGTPIFAIGRSGGMNPPHFTRGIKSTDLDDEILARAAITIFYGNSGGGLFDESSGHLIGLADRIRYRRHQMIPSWAEYTPANLIRKELNEIGLVHAVDLPEKEFNWDVHLYSALILLVGTYVVIRVRRRKALRNMQRNNA